MKVNRVILALNNNPLYCKMWNLVSYVWKTKFDIIPTLIFNGTEKEFLSNNFNFDYGEFKIINKINEVSESNPDWSVTWSLFWGASQYKDDICMLCGADQIPITNFFFEKIKEVQDDKFVVGFADAYQNYTEKTLGYFNTQTNVLYPSSHLVGKGYMFEKIFHTDNDWEKEIYKVFQSRSRYYLNNHYYPGKLWGLDECYASEKISIFEHKDSIIYLDIFWNFWQKRRMDCQHSAYNVNLDLVKEGYYSEISCKQVDFYKSQLQNIISNIPKYS